MKASKSKTQKAFSKMNLHERAAHFASSPFIIKKREQAIAFIEKHGLPEDFARK